MLSILLSAAMWALFPSGPGAGAILQNLVHQCADTKTERFCDSVILSPTLRTLSPDEQNLLKGIAYYNKFLIREEAFLARPKEMIGEKLYTQERGYFMLKEAEKAQLKDLGKKTVDALQQTQTTDEVKGILRVLFDLPLDL